MRQRTQALPAIAATAAFEPLPAGHRHIYNAGLPIHGYDEPKDKRLLKTMTKVIDAGHQNSQGFFLKMK